MADVQEDWANAMRLKFSPPAMLHEDGKIDQDFFKPTKVVVLDSKKWGSEEDELLTKGIAQYGFGQWREISENLLPLWDEQTLSKRAVHLGEKAP